MRGLPVRVRSRAPGFIRSSEAVSNTRIPDLRFPPPKIVVKRSGNGEGLGRLDGYLVAEPCQPLDGIPNHGIPPVFIVEIRSEVFVADAVPQDVIDDFQNPTADRDGGSLLSPAGLPAPKWCLLTLTNLPSSRSPSEPSEPALLRALDASGEGRIVRAPGKGTRSLTLYPAPLAHATRQTTAPAWGRPSQCSRACSTAARGRHRCSVRDLVRGSRLDTPGSTVLRSVAAAPARSIPFQASA
jgi:hypothetical protein